MPKRAKNIWKRKDGRWEARYPIGKKENGATRYRSIYGKSYAEAKRKLVECQIASGLSLGHKRKKFSDVLDEWMMSVSLKQKEATKLKYENLIENHIKPELGGYNIESLNESRICIFLDNKRKNGRIDKKGGLATSYVKTMYLIIQAALSYGEHQGYCMAPKTSVCKLPSQPTEITVLTAEQQTKLENILISENTINGLGVLISLNTGLRIGEICALQWEDIDMEHKILHVRHTVARIKNKNPAIDAKTILILDSPKTKTSCRDIPITPKLETILNNALTNSSSNFLISSSNEFVSPRTYEYRFHKKLKECQIPQVNFHALRHTFATRCIEKGVDVKTLSEILGHSNVSITLNTYVHSSMDLKRIQLEKLD